MERGRGVGARRVVEGAWLLAVVEAVVGLAMGEGEGVEAAVGGTRGDAAKVLSSRCWALLCRQRRQRRRRLL
jgi:hypothetical protein